MRRILIVLVAVAAILGGCALRGDDNANGGLANTSWTVQSISGVATVGPARPTMTFVPDGTVTGSASCNQYSAMYRTDGSSIAIGPVSSTLMLCDGDIGLQETAFLASVQGATSWRQGEDGNLVLSGAGEIVAGPGVAEGPPPEAEPITDLGRTAWTLAEMGGTADFAHLVPTLEFGADGSVSGFAGCNQVNGSYTVTGDRLAMSQLATTKMACERPASEVEAEYLAALAGVTGWSVGADGRLVLDGPVPLTFAPG